jgi:hypothetical protein
MDHRPMPMYWIYALCAALALINGGCASKPVQAQWTDPQFSNHSLRGAKVLVVCDSNEAAVKRICEEQMSAQLSTIGAAPVIVPIDAGAASLNERALTAARSAQAKAVLISTVAPEVTSISPGPSIGVGIGGFGGFGGSRSGGVSTGVGVSVPVGKERVDTAYAANLSLTDADSGRLMWTGKVMASGRDDINQQLAFLAKNGLEAAQSAGIF